MDSKDLTGKTVGRLTVLYRVENNAQKRPQWKCRCSCGTEKIIAACDLRKALSNKPHRGTRSCGCLIRDTVPKGTKHPLYGRKGKDSPRWKGGRRKNQQGYVLLWNPEHPNAQKGGHVLEHIAVMVSFLGRPLSPSESVHHINGIREDNSIKNLELWSKSQPPGQRAADKVKWAKEIISIYEPLIASGII